MPFLNPLISVIIPVYNGARFLAEAVASIQAQEYQPLEIIIVDDGSTDETAKIAAGFGDLVRYCKQTNAGPSAARNRGLKMAGGEFIGFLDVDDLWPPDKLQLQLPRLINDPQLDVVLGRIQYLQLPGADELKLNFTEPNQTMTHIHLGNALYRNRVFEKVGLFNESLRFSEDQDWFLRARENLTKMVILEQVTLLYRIHDSNMTRAKGTFELRLLEVLKKSIDRRRQNKIKDLPPWSDYDEKQKVAPNDV